jgi:F-type H+-transporting ATPase subunit delta
MSSQVLIRRYTQGLVNSIDDQVEYETLYKNLLAVQALLAGQPKLLELLQSPFLPVSKRAAIAEEILIKMFHIKPPPEIPSIEAAEPEPYPPARDDLSIGAKTARFLLLLIEHDRMPIFNAILDGLPAAWNEEQGITTFEVASVVELNAEQKKRLTSKLEKLEKRPVVLTFTTDPTLIGGLSIRKGNIVYDVSIEGSLQRLKEKISEG